MFWLGVTAAYVALIGVGMMLGHWLAGRRRGWGGRGRDTVAPVVPIGPTHALDAPALGSAFYHAFLPGVRFGDLVAADAS